MKKVMIVDDEALVRVGLQSIIDWNEHGYEIIGAYKNGVEAWQAAQENIPDVILTDIKMPKMNGLELIEKVKKQFKKTNIIILSSHEDFDYTRKAIQLNVQDYILKHKLEPLELLRVLNSLKYEDVDHAADSTSSIELEKQKLLVFEESESHFNDAFPKQFPNLYSLLRLKGYCKWVVFQTAAVKTNILESEMKAIKVLVGETLNRLNNVLYLGTDAHRFHAIILFDNAEVSAEVSGSIINELSRTANKQLDAELATGASSIFEVDYTLIPLMREQAEKSLLNYFYLGRGNYVFDDRISFRHLDESEWIEIQKNVKDRIWQENKNELLCWFKDTGAFLKDKNIYPQEATRIVRMAVNYLVDLAMERYQLDLFKIESPHFEKLLNMSMLDSVQTWVELLEEIEWIIKSAMEVFRQTRDKRSWIHEATTYINENYDKPLQLENLAQQFNFSINYFSQKFQQGTGYSYTDYLTRVRINKAMELFKTTNLTTDEIAIKVGYPNSNYFIKVFKRTTGLTITDFKK